MTNLCLAAKFVATAAMLAEVNYYSSKLELKTEYPIRRETLISCNLSFYPPTELMARLDTTGYSYSFFGNGQLSFITKIEGGGRLSYGIPRGRLESLESLYQRLYQLETKITTNDAYRLATNWLEAVDIDVARLEKEKSLRIGQPGKGKETDKNKKLPVFYLDWGEPDPAVRVMVSGITGELLYLRQEDLSYSRRPSSLIKDLDKLLAIPNEEFAKYSEEDLEALVQRFAAVNYSSNLTAKLPPADIQKPLAPEEAQQSPQSLEKETQERSVK